MSAQDTEFDREIAKLLRPAGVPPVDARTMWLAGFFDADNPAAEWTKVLALYWRLDHEYPGLLDEKAMPVMCIERGWLSLEPDGPIRQPTHDGSVRGVIGSRRRAGTPRLRCCREREGDHEPLVPD
jgi:hypothetical protein